MIIQNATIVFKLPEVTEIDPETGYRSEPSHASWSEPHACQVKAVRFNQLAKTSHGGEAFTSASYEVFIEEDVPCPSERVKLVDLSGRELGEFSIISLEPLEAVCEMRILV